jgi:hypothetical protein
MARKSIFKLLDCRWKKPPLEPYQQQSRGATKSNNKFVEDSLDGNRGLDRGAAKIVLADCRCTFCQDNLAKPGRRNLVSLQTALSLVNVTPEFKSGLTDNPSPSAHKISKD